MDRALHGQEVPVYSYGQLVGMHEDSQKSRDAFVETGKAAKF